ncbi:MAG: hypothetical protein L3J08_04445 [Flavobacteriaceae bacterium]|nr:hypothetical protein [Flavobacteriaceae bacterium]
MSDINLRKSLGNFNSIICLKALITGLEDVLGKSGAYANLIFAGRIRGSGLVKDLDLSNTKKPLEEWSQLIKDALGVDGTRLCIIKKIEIDGGILRTYLEETVCSAGEEKGSSRKVSFTLGVIQGALEEVTGKKLIGRQTGSVLRGQNYDIIDFKEAY